MPEAWDTTLSSPPVFASAHFQITPHPAPRGCLLPAASVAKESTQPSLPRVQMCPPRLQCPVPTAPARVSTPEQLIRALLASQCPRPLSHLVHSTPVCLHERAGKALLGLRSLGLPVLTGLFGFCFLILSFARVRMGTFSWNVLPTRTNESFCPSSRARRGTWGQRGAQSGLRLRGCRAGFETTALGSRVCCDFPMLHSGAFNNSSG